VRPPSPPSATRVERQPQTAEAKCTCRPPWPHVPARNQAGSDHNKSRKNSHKMDMNTTAFEAHTYAWSPGEMVRLAGYRAAIAAGLYSDYGSPDDPITSGLVARLLAPASDARLSSTAQGTHPPPTRSTAQRARRGRFNDGLK
jgi:hypothetical protein